MDGLYQFVAIGMGVILFGLFLAGIMIVVRNIKRRMLPGQDTRATVFLTEAYWEEKRQQVRVGLVWPVSIKTSNSPIQAKTKDISLGGAFIVCEKPLPLKEMFSISINIPDHGPLNLNSEVIWSNANVPEERVITRGMGVRFLGITKQERNILDEAITFHMEEQGGERGRSLK